MCVIGTTSDGCHTIGVCARVNRNSGCGHEESHLMHDTEHSI